MVLVLALGLGSGLAYLRAGRNQAINTPMDMPNPMQAPFLGYIPVTPIAGYLDNETSSAMFESIRIVRTALLSRLNGQDNTTILVTSASEGTGKTTFTMMLGKSLANAGKKILVIDADFKKMSLTQQFEDMYNNPGFVQALRDPSKYKENIFEAYDLGFDLMPAGKLSDDNTVPEEIANGAFKLLIDKLHRLYDVILLDSSPILPIADATILSSQVDGIIMVERENISHRSDIINALTRLSSARGSLLGTVFLGSGNKQYGYGYGYGYGHK
jgi:capsular exopolysaccharide synthesis family protein